MASRTLLLAGLLTTVCLGCGGDDGDSGGSSSGGAGAGGTSQGGTGGGGNTGGTGASSQGGSGGNSGGAAGSGGQGPARIDQSIADLRLWAASGDHVSHGDVDGDGKLDVLVADDRETTVHHDVLATTPVETELPGLAPFAWILPDIDGNGSDEVATGHRNDRLLRVWAGLVPGAASPDPVGVISDWNHGLTSNRLSREVYPDSGWGLGAGVMIPSDYSWHWLPTLPTGDVAQNDIAPDRYYLTQSLKPSSHPLIGDLDGDGAADLSDLDLGVAGSDCTDTSETGYVVRKGPVSSGGGAAFGLNAPEIARLCSPDSLPAAGSNSTASWDMAVGDWNGDGTPDLAIGVGGANDGRGKIGVFWGPVPAQLRLEEADARISGPSPDGNFGKQLANGGDLDGDGVDDLIIGAERDTQTEPIGLLYVFTVAQLEGERTALDAAARVTPPDVRALTFRNIYPVGDVDGDGLADILVHYNESATLLSSPFRSVQ